MLEFQQDVVSTIIPELTNTRLRRVIKSMPPYTPETVIDFTLVQARGVFAVRAPASPTNNEKPRSAGVVAPSVTVPSSKWRGGLVLEGSLGILH